MRALHLKRFCIAAIFLSPLLAQNGGRYSQVNLVSDVAGMANQVDPNLVNAWGIAASPTGPWWVNSAGKSLSLVYDAGGIPFPLANPLRVTVPPSPASIPTGIAFNGTGQFEVSAGRPAVFLFATIKGVISGWNPQANPTAAIAKVTTTGGVYTGLAIGPMSGRNVLYAANFKAGKIDVFDSQFNPMSMSSSAFHDSAMPAGYAPFNVETIAGSVFVMFAKVGDDGEEEKGAGLGFVDKFSPDGVLQMRLENGPWMNAPWGIAVAPDDFGPMSRRLLVGQFGGGQIASFDDDGRFRGLVLKAEDNPIEIEGLWGIRFGNGGTAGGGRELYFAAGIDDEKHGLFGKIIRATDDNNGNQDNGNNNNNNNNNGKGNSGK